MRLLLCLPLLLASLPVLGTAQQTVVVTSSAGAGGLGLYADGAAWPTNGGFTFEAGVFPAGFDLGAAGPSAWIAAWVPARATASSGVVNTWFQDGASTYFSIAGSSVALQAGDSPGAQYYVWGYNTRAVGVSAEWILLTNPAWKVMATSTPRLPDQFDTKDPGTIAVVGQLSNGGMDLRSASILAIGPAIASIVSDFTVPVGQPAVLSVTAIGPGLSYQWYVGAKGDTSNPIAGAVRSTYAVGALNVTTRFWVRISDGTRLVDSETVTVTAAGAGNVVNTAHVVASLGYIAGQRVTIRNEIAYPGTLSRLEVSVLLPAGWSYLGSETAGVPAKPSPGKTELLEWTWTPVPAGPLTLTYTISVPAVATGDQSLSSLVTAVRDGVSYQRLSHPDPLVLKVGPRFHSADTDRDGRIGLQELTRIIQLYNTRVGTVRTGSYRAKSDSEDGFDPDASGAVAGALSIFHTADNSPRDGRLSLLELTRVVELYNTREGTSRSGAYHARGDTEDGFVAGASP